MKWTLEDIEEVKPIVEKYLPNAQIEEESVDTKTLNIVYTGVHSFLKDFPGFVNFLKNESLKYDIDYDNFPLKIENAIVNITIEYTAPSWMFESKWDYEINHDDEEFFDISDDNTFEFNLCLKNCFILYFEDDGEFGKTVNSMTKELDAWCKGEIEE